MGKTKTDPSVVAAVVLLVLVGIAGARAWAVLMGATNDPAVGTWIEQLKAAALGTIAIALFAAPVVLLFAYTAGPPARATTPTRPRATRPRATTTAKGIPVYGLARVQALTHNRQTAERLLWQCWQQNSQKGWDWVIDKVVFDLERDRRP